jgi:V8-like Glu-specific endopeptidase
MPESSNLDSSGPTLGQQSQAIVGGTLDSGDPEVFMLGIQYVGSSAGSELCSATLIGSQTLLTAAHCVDPRMQNATSVKVVAVNVAQISQSTTSDWIPAETQVYHPDWNAQTRANDVAVVKLSRAPGLTPRQLNRASIDGLTGQPLREVGYGITSSAAKDSGTRRQVGLVFNSIDPTHFRVGDSGQGVCGGDSGGPSFYTFPDGVERIVGVHSYGDDACTWGANTRVDTVLPFIYQWLGQWEQASCGPDGLCKMDCATPDVDCYCVADGQCNPLCQPLSMDPDCPADCVENGVCSAEPCPIPDPDCKAVGETCSIETDCQSRLCVKDPQHPDFYCSTPCTASSDCPSGMECTGSACEFSQNPPAPTVTAPHPRLGCTAAGGGPLSLLGLFAAGILRRRRA